MKNEASNVYEMHAVKECRGVNTFIGQTAIITGASGAVGKAIALSLGRAGANLCLVGRKMEALEAIAESTRANGCRVQSYQADLGSDQDVNNLSESILQDFEHIDLLVHSAGVISLGEMERAFIKDLDWQYLINVRAPYVLTQAFLSALSARQGQIVFINSSVGLTARAKVGQYAATKHALKAMADSLREEVNPRGLRVLSVFLGRTASSMQVAVHAKEGRSYDPDRLLQPEDVASLVLCSLSLPRTAEVTDVSIRPLRKPSV